MRKRITKKDLEALQDARDFVRKNSFGEETARRLHKIWEILIAKEGK